MARIILHQDKEGQEFQTEWKYRRIIGQLNFLEKPARHVNVIGFHPTQTHKMAIPRIWGYLMATRSEGFILEPTISSMDLWCDADFSGNWKADTAHIDTTTA